MKYPVSNPYVGILDAVPQAIFSLRTITNKSKQIINFQWLTINKPARMLFAKKNARLIGKPFFVQPLSAEDSGLMAEFALVVITGKPLQKEYPLKSIFAGSRHQITAIKYKNGLVVVCDDIAKYITLHPGSNLQEHVCKSTLPLNTMEKGNTGHNVFMQAPALICTFTGPEHIYDMVNSYYQEIFGKHLIPGKKISDVFPDFKNQGIIEKLDNIFKTGESYLDIKVAVTRTDDGISIPEERFYNFSFKPIKDSNEKVTGLLKCGFEVTKHVLDRETVTKQAKDLSVILETIPQIAWTASADGSITYFNQRYFEYTGISITQAKNMEWKTVIHPSMVDDYLKAMQHSLITGDDFYLEALFKKRDDEGYRWYLSRAIAIRNEKGEITLWVGTATDIDDQKNLEEELRKLQALEKSVRLGAEAQTAWFNDMVMQAPFIICTFRGPDHVHELINPPYQELFGDKQLIGRTVIKALPEFGGQVFVEILDMVYKRGETISRKEVSLLIPGKLTKNLEENFVNFTCQPLYDFEKKVEGILVFAYNVTDQVLARRILEKNAEDLNIILEAIPQIAWVSKPDGSIFYYNSNWYHYTGLTIAETEKDGWWPVLHPSLRDKTMEEWLHAVQTCEIFEMETLLKRSADQSYRWHLSKAAPVRNKLGDVTLWVGTFTDINHENNLRGELENLVLERTKEVMLSNEELKLSNIKLEEFAFVASHDLKEPLRKIITNSDFLQMEFGDQLNNTGKQYIHRIHESAFRMQKLIEDLLSFSQLSHNVLDYKTIDLKQLVNSIIAEQFLVDKEEMATITIKKLPVIECIPTMIEQLFTNLLSNALKFVKPGIPAKIEISFNYISGSHTGIPSAQPHEKFCRIYVKDNGIGFDKKYLEQIFIIFKRLNSQNKYQGTGIGLALCKKIVENHHGSLTANSRLNDGATFIIILPCKQRKF